MTPNYWLVFIRFDDEDYLTACNDSGLIPAAGWWDLSDWALDRM
jgi:hypothetical protein